MNDRFIKKLWHTNRKTFLKEFSILQTINSDGIVEHTYFEYNPNIQQLERLSSCQIKEINCTGLKDKNGKLIFDGDIVRFKDCNDILVVKYQKEMACFAPQFYRNGEYGGRLWFDDYDSSECQFYKSNNFEVIGNIFENKELLNDR